MAADRSAAAAGGRSRLRRIVAVLLLIGLAAAAGRVAAADPPFRTIDATELQALLDRGVPVVDLRTAGEWRKTGVIAGSRRITAFDPQGQFVAGFPQAFAAVAGPGDEVALICWTGARSEAIAGVISGRAGYRNVYNVAGGLAAWLGAGRAVDPCPGC